MTSFNEGEFLDKVNKALETVKRVLDNTKHPCLPSEVSHEYDDKFQMAEFVTAANISASINVLNSIGVTNDKLDKIRDWNVKNPISLGFKWKRSCNFVRQQHREMPQATTVTETSTFGIGSKKTVVSTKVTEYMWSLGLEFKLIVFREEDYENAIDLYHSSSTCEFATPTDAKKFEEVKEFPMMCVNISWLLGHLVDGNPEFSIDRKDEKCRTPKRNPNIDEALMFSQRFNQWSKNIDSIFTFSGELTALGLNQRDQRVIEESDSIFVPILPLLEKNEQGISTLGNINSLINTQMNSIGQSLKRVENCDGLYNGNVMIFRVLLKHIQEIHESFKGSIDYLEQLLYNQLHAAVGKEITSKKFMEYMKFHYKRLFKSEFVPQSFAHVVRLSNHDPEGVVTLYQGNDDFIVDTIKVSAKEKNMFMSLNASTKVSFKGESFVHGVIFNKFASEGNIFKLAARARQFSSYILLLGRITGPNEFDAEHGILVKNKDLLDIPLDLETIPTLAEFQDAIESLSPEQQRFAKAFRSMQLQSTIFAICVIQVKPQIERLLNLDVDSLKKEIQLMQDIMELFVQYQIPADMLSFDGEISTLAATKLNLVKENVEKMKKIIDDQKKKDVENAKTQRNFVGIESTTNESYVREETTFGLVKGKSNAFNYAPMSSSGYSCAAPSPMPRPAPPCASMSTSFAAPVPVPAVNPPPQYTTVQPSESSGNAKGSTDDIIDIPRQLEEIFKNESGALRPTIIRVGPYWNLKSKASILSETIEYVINSTKQKEEKDKVFDLIDALSKSGALTLENTSLHVIIASTQCFDKTFVDTVIQESYNPIETVEKSVLLLASTLHKCPVKDLIDQGQINRLLECSPKLVE